MTDVLWVSCAAGNSAALRISALLFVNFDFKMSGLSQSVSLSLGLLSLVALAG
jgi:hypothetical protein